MNKAPLEQNDTSKAVLESENVDLCVRTLNNIKIMKE